MPVMCGGTYGDQRIPNYAAESMSICQPAAVPGAERVRVRERASAERGACEWHGQADSS